MTVHYIVFTCSCVLSLPFSSDPGRNRSWRYRVVEVSVQVLGEPSLLSAVQEALEGASSVLRALEFGPFHSDPCLSLVSSSATQPTQSTSTSTSLPSSTTHSLSSSPSTCIYTCTCTCTCTGTSTCLSNTASPLSVSTPSVDELFSPTVLTSQSVPCASVSTCTHTSPSTTSIVDELFCPWNLSLVSTPSNVLIPSLPLSLPLHLIFWINYFPLGFCLLGVPPLFVFLLHFHRLFLSLHLHLWMNSFPHGCCVLSLPHRLLLLPRFHHLSLPLHLLSWTSSLSDHVHIINKLTTTGFFQNHQIHKRLHLKKNNQHINEVLSAEFVT